MINVPENELFSAYLDGELTAAEQAEMERLLATSPAARQLLEELRTLSSTLQSLPAHKLNEDISQQVLRVAEQRTLSGQTESDSFSPELVPSSGRWRALAGRLSRPRIWIWPAVAASVALMLAVLFPEQGARVVHLPADRHVALAPARSAPAEEHSIGRTMPMAEAAPFAGSMRPDAGPAVIMAAPIPTAPAAPPASASAPVPVVAQSPALASMEAAQPAESKPADVAARPMKGAKEGPAAGGRFAKEGLGEEARKSAGEVLVVRCDVTAESLAKGAFQKVLVARQIHPTEASAQDRVELILAASQLPRIMEKKSRAVDRDAIRDEPSDKRAESLGRIVYLYAEATPAQLAGVLADLKTQPAVVVSLPNVSVVAGPLGYGGGQTATPFLGKAGAAMKEADAYPSLQTDGQSQRARMNEQMQPSMAKGTRGAAVGDDSQNVQNQRNQPSLAESAAGAAPGNQMQNVQSRAGVANAIADGAEANQSQVSQSRSSFGMRMGGQQRRGDAETTEKQMRQRAADTGTADQKAAQTQQQTAGPPSPVPAMPGMAPGAGGVWGRSGMLGGLGGPPSAPSQRLKAKSDAGAAVEQEAGPVEGRQHVVFVLRVLDREQIAAEKSGKAEAGQAKAAMMDAARAAPAKPAASAAPASPTKK
jgi:anti-sigma factor RsiW